MCVWWIFFNRLSNSYCCRRACCWACEEDNILGLLDQSLWRHLCHCSFCNPDLLVDPSNCIWFLVSAINIGSTRVCHAQQVHLCLWGACNGEWCICNQSLSPCCICWTQNYTTVVLGHDPNCVPSTYVIFWYYSHWKTLELGKMIITSNFLSNRQPLISYSVFLNEINK